MEGKSEQPIEMRVDRTLSLKMWSKMLTSRKGMFEETFEVVKDKPQRSKLDVLVGLTSA